MKPSQATLRHEPGAPTRRRELEVALHQLMGGLRQLN
jgi:hypothetical protein